MGWLGVYTFVTGAHKDDLGAGKAGVQEHSGFMKSLLVGPTCLSSIGSDPAKPGGLTCAVATWLGPIVGGLALSFGFRHGQSFRGQPYGAIVALEILQVRA